MCLINISWQSHEQYPLIILANRDEFYERPTEPLHQWKSGILAGKDLQDGGTWMGIAPDGRFAALTNYRDPSNMQSGRPSRGQLVRRFLEEMTVDELHPWLMHHGIEHNGFNLLYGNKEELFYYSTVDNSYRQLKPGHYGLSNAMLDTPWPKLVKTRTAFSTILDQEFSSDKMFDLFGDTELAPQSQLPSTGVDPELEHQLSAVCIRLPNYGTRSTALLTAGLERGNRYLERSFKPQQETELSFDLD